MIIKIENMYILTSVREKNYLNGTLHISITTDKATFHLRGVPFELKNEKWNVRSFSKSIYDKTNQKPVTYPLFTIEAEGDKWIWQVKQQLPEYFKEYQEKNSLCEPTIALLKKKNPMKKSNSGAKHER